MNSLVTTGNVLVVDECADLCRLLHITLLRGGFHVQWATSSREAVELASEEPELDLVIIQWELPRLDETLKCVRRLHPTAAILLLKDCESALLPAPGTEILEKPFPVSALRRAVDRALHARPAIHQVREAEAIAV